MFTKYDRNGKGSLDVHSFVVSLISPLADPEPWFQDRPTYEFHVLNRAPPKKVSVSVCSVRLRLLCACNPFNYLVLQKYSSLITSILAPQT